MPMLQHIGIMEKNNSVLGLCWDNGKENGNYYSILARVHAGVCPSLAGRPRGLSWRTRLFLSKTPCSSTQNRSNVFRAAV